MKCNIIYRQESHRWLAFGADPTKPDSVIDTNQFVISDGASTVLLDPGGSEVFPAMLGALAAKVDIKTVRHLFISHQDPDVSSSLPLWRAVCREDLETHVSWLWTGFVSHFDRDAPIKPIPDEGTSISLASGITLEIVPAHYMHSSGNFNVYDPEAKIYFAGDIGASLVPADLRAKGLFVGDFESHTQYMEGFHRRWLPSNRAKAAWVAGVREREVEILATQHGLCFRGEDVDRFLDWLEALDVGCAIPNHEAQVSV